MPYGNYDDVKPDDEVSLFPSSDSALAAELDWCRKAFVAAQDARMQYEDKWLRDYRLYRLHVDKNKNDWRHKAFIPLIFYSIQSILPKIIAQLPEPIVEGVGPQDEAAAPRMEATIKWAAKETKLQLRMFEQFWSALLYGTGILKVRVGEKKITRYSRVPVMEPLQVSMPGQPVMDPETGMPLIGPDGPVMEDMMASLGEVPTGRTKVEKNEEPVYIGPVADYIDIFNFYPAPEACDSIDARYIIHREWMPLEWVKEKVKSGFYKVPEDFKYENDNSGFDDPKFKRLSRIGYGGSRSGDQTTNMCQVWDVWKRDEGTVTTVLNENIVVRKVRTPYTHGMQPFVRAVDYLIPGELWGQGEAEILENLQDLENTVWNARMDELKMKLAKMFMVDEQALVDPREITRLRPGGFIRVNNPNGLPIQNVIAPIELGEVLTTAYTEAGEIERMIEKISGTTPAATGTGEVQPSDTATSTALFSEAANTRLTMKTRVAELGGFGDLMQMYGSILQQFTPPDMLMRVTGPQGPEFQPIGEDVTGGGFRYSIQAASSTVSEQTKLQQDMSLIQIGASLVDPATGGPLAEMKALWEDYLRDSGKKNPERYVFTPPPPEPEQGQGQLPPELAALMGGGAPPENGQQPAPAGAQQGGQYG